jgi:hypothetical protein
MRRELQTTTKNFATKLNFTDIPECSYEYSLEITKIGAYVGLMRFEPHVRYQNGEIVDIVSTESEIPTRISKQLLKLSQLLAIIEQNKQVSETVMEVIRRVARDTLNQSRQHIIGTYSFVGKDRSLSIADLAGYCRPLQYRTVKNQVIIMEAMNILECDSDNQYKLTDDFKELYTYIYPHLNSKKEPKSDFFFEQS